MSRRKRLIALSILVVLTMLVNHLSVLTTVFANEEKVSAMKSAEWVTEEEKAKVTFIINATSETIPTTQIEKTDIVLVIDRSGSMSGDKLKNAKAAAKLFVNSLLIKEYKELVKLAVVSYSESATKNTSLTNNTEILNSAIDGLKANGGTNIQAGIKAARELLSVSSSKNKYIVLLSDGAPTYSYEGTSIQTEPTALNDGSSTYLLTAFNYSKVHGNGNDYTFSSYNIKNVIKVPVTYYDNSRYKGWYDSEFNKYTSSKVKEKTNGDKVGSTGYVEVEKVSTISNHGIPTISEASFAKDAGITLYTIAYDVKDNSNANFVMENVATSSANYFSSANSEEAIQGVFVEISETIEETVANGKGAVITDVIPEYFNIDLDSFLPNDDGVQISPDGRILTWTLGDLAEGINTYS